jgi:STE24 endopeptidase
MAHRAIALLAAMFLIFAAHAAIAGQAGAAPAGSAHFNPEAATEAYMATLPPAAQARSNAYFEGGYWLALWDTLIAAAVAWLLLVTKWSSRMRAAAERSTRWRWLQTAIYAAQYVVISTLLTLPWGAYEGFFREHQYGMSNQSLSGWLGDQAKGLFIGLIFGCIAAAAIYAVIRRAPRTWWLWGAMVAMLVLVFQVAIGPTYLEPVFNRFYPLPDSALKQEILSLARANGVPAQQVYEFDASKQTTKVSAHVSGLFGTAQISLNDNLMNRATPEEIKAVLGHEMGHYVLNHVYKFIAPAFIIVVAGFALLHWGYGRLQPWLSRWGVGPVTDVAGMPALVAIFGVYLFLLTPVVNTLTRTMETEADAYGLNAARQPDGAAQAALLLSEYRKMRPGPLEEFVFYDHPSGWNRIHRAMIWKAENVDAADIAAYEAAHHPPGN